MDIASLVLGIISIIIAFIPLCGSVVFLPAIVGLILGIIALVKKSKANESKTMSIVGTVLNSCAIVIIIAWIVFAASSAGKNMEEFNRMVSESAAELQESESEVNTKSEEIKEAAEELKSIIKELE